MFFNATFLAAKFDSHYLCVTGVHYFFWSILTVRIISLSIATVVHHDQRSKTIHWICSIFRGILRDLLSPFQYIDKIQDNVRMVMKMLIEYLYWMSFLSFDFSWSVRYQRSSCSVAVDECFTIFVNHVNVWRQRQPIHTSESQAKQSIISCVQCQPQTICWWSWL